MNIYVRHHTIYRYESDVTLLSHSIRLIPRSDRNQLLESYQVEITPKPQGATEILDFEGNRCLQAWFSGTTNVLEVVAEMRVKTTAHSPFNFLLHPDWMYIPIQARTHPIDQDQYRRSSLIQQIFLNMQSEYGLSLQGYSVDVLSQLCLCIYRSIKQIVRESGEPWAPEHTWQTKVGSCRDMAVLMIFCCRELGFSSRFVSGYLFQRSQEEQYMHAWVEVYMEGAGWCGLDPTSGLWTGDQYIAVASTMDTQNAAPITGKIAGNPKETTLHVNIHMDEF